MTQSTHDLIAAKAARLRELIHLAEAADDGPSADPTPVGAGGGQDARYGPTWSGGGWAN
jgi:hypothetical protein